jgi:hypothetical protein
LPIILIHHVTQCPRVCNLLFKLSGLVWLLVLIALETIVQYIVSSWFLTLKRRRPPSAQRSLLLEAHRRCLKSLLVSESAHAQLKNSVGSTFFRNVVTPHNSPPSFLSLKFCCPFREKLHANQRVSCI